MPVLKNTRWVPIMMAVSILAIAAFQFYWLWNSYQRESRNLEMRSNFLFKETVRAMQWQKFRLDRMNDSASTRIMVQNRLGAGPERMSSMIDILMRKAKDSTKTLIISREGRNDSVSLNDHGYGRRDRFVQLISEVDSIQDSVRVPELRDTFARKLLEQNIDVPFTISRVKPHSSKDPVFNEVTLGFAKPITYRLDLGAANGYLLRRISVPIIFSIFLIGLTILSFTLLYRNLMRERRLADIKNEFISNITHELKTPIATVSVAIEALRGFHTNLDPARSREYLDISANELQRLSLLVDKVLKLSMFEKRQIELRFEPLILSQLIDEVVGSMRLQFEKHEADVSIQIDGDTTMMGDRLHLVSVLFNLLDNAVKYSKGNPVIRIKLEGRTNDLLLVVEDDGIGIPEEYRGRIFEKFFRVPTGNLHNAKGYGLGLSYVSHVVEQHNGTIRAEACDSGGCRFILELPRHQS